MGWFVALLTIVTLVMLGLSFWASEEEEAEKDWRDGAEGLRERLERNGVRR